MRAKREEFSQSDRIAIVGRATDSSGRVHCEGCGIWVKRRADYEIDHNLAEGLRVDRTRKLTADDGKLLCVAVCHPPKTKSDRAAIDEAKRREAAELGVKPPRRKINWGHESEKRPPYRRAAGVPEIARRFR